MSLGALLAALLVGGVIAGAFAGRLPASGKAALVLALVAPVGLYFSLGSC